MQLRSLGIVLLASQALAGLATACAAPADHDEPHGSTVQRAIVSESQATRAFEIAGGIDYLPWGYTADGCYARALYMSMELAIERIPSSSEYIVADDNAVLDPGNGIQWGWHVAPMVKIGADGVPTIIDPSLFSAPEVARSLDAWVQASNPVPAGAYKTYLVQGSHYWQSNNRVDNAPIGSFAELDPFHGEDIESACGVAYTYLEREQPAPTADALDAKRQHLVARTRELIDGLHAVGKLDDLASADLKCEPSAPAPDPSDDGTTSPDDPSGGEAPDGTAN
jgi:hypothetical protein